MSALLDLQQTLKVKGVIYELAEIRNRVRQMKCDASDDPDDQLRERLLFLEEFIRLQEVYLQDYVREKGSRDL